MGRGNDAIPSWSGFNYQGKMMLLCVLQKINEIKRSSESINLYEVNLEETEDYMILKDGIVEKLYQVKATLSKSKWSQYTEALNKLIAHRTSAGNPTASCVFVVAKEIADWEEVLNPFRLTVTLYKYMSAVVTVDKVKDYIITEIEEYIANEGQSYLNIEAVYGDLCIFLDNKIAELHMQGAKNRKYRIPFEEIVNVILGALNKAEEEYQYRLKEETYKHIVQGIQSSMSSICGQVCNSNFADCDKNCAAKEAHRKILEVPNFNIYCKIINPEKVDGWDDYMSLLQRVPSEALEHRILYLFHKSNNCELIESNNSIVGMKSAFSANPKGMIIPTLLSLHDPFSSTRQGSLQCIFQSIRDNSDIYSYLVGNSIVADSRTFSGDISQAEISSAWSTVNENRVDVLSNSITILSLEDLLNWFMSEGGNHA